MNIKEFAQRYSISLSKVRKIHKDGYLVGVDKDEEIADRMKRYLTNKRRLSVEMLIALIREPALRGQLDHMRKRAQVELDEIGDPDRDALPAANWGDIVGASINDAGALDVLADWLLQAIPIGGCGYHYIAVRLLWNVPEERVAQVYSRIPRALINVRAMPRLAGLSILEKGTTKFLRPAAKNFDL